MNYYEVTWLNNSGEYGSQIIYAEDKETAEKVAKAAYPMNRKIRAKKLKLD